MFICRRVNPIDVGKSGSIDVASGRKFTTYSNTEHDFVQAWEGLKVLNQRDYCSNFLPAKSSIAFIHNVVFPYNCI